MKKADCCPKDCAHETFEYCAASGTHCDKHCVCRCYDCVAERERRLDKDQAP